MPGSFVHLELTTDDTDRAKEFYRDLFGWQYNEWPLDGAIYWGVKTPEPPGGGMMTNPMPHAPSQWVPYISVDDIHDIVARARSAGAEILVDHRVVGEAGEMAILRDPAGATIGLWKQVAPPPAPPTNGSSSASASGGKKKSAKKQAGAKKAGKPKKAAATAKAAKAGRATASSGKAAKARAGKAAKSDAPTAAKGGKKGKKAKGAKPKKR